MAELEEIPNVDADVSGIEVEMLDYDYVNKCDDTKILKKILNVLISGKEGHYPHLIQTVEEKLLKLLPNKEREKITRIKQKATPQDIAQAESDISKWQSNIANKDETLKSIGGKKFNDNSIFESSNVKDKIPINSNKMIPPVRGTANLKGVDVKKIDIKEVKSTQKYSGDVDDSIFISQLVNEISQNEEARLDEWERYNKSMNISLNEIQASKRRSKLYKQEIESVLHKHKNLVGIFELTTLQRNNIAERERLKGNEFYRVGENEKAYECYTLSIAFDSQGLNAAIVFANRAMVCLKLDKFDTAEDDCSRSIQLDLKYVKSWMRRGMARFKKGRYYEATLDFIQAIKLDSNNNELKSLFEKSKAKYEEVEGKEFEFPTSVTSSESTSSYEEKPFKTYNEPKESTANINKFKHHEDTVAVELSRTFSFPNIFFPSSGSAVIATGVCELEDSSNVVIENTSPLETSVDHEVYTRVQIITENDSDDDDAPEMNMTRVPIIIEDDDESEDDIDNDHGLESSYPRIPVVDGDDLNSETFTVTRVPIIVDDEDDNDTENYSTTRVPIIEEEDEDDLVSESASQTVSSTTASVIQLNEEDSKSTHSAYVTWRNRANGFLSQAKFSEAVSAAGNCLSSKVDDFTAKVIRILAYSKLNMHEEVIIETTSLLATKPDDILLLYYRASAYLSALHSNKVMSSVISVIQEQIKLVNINESEMEQLHQFIVLANCDMCNVLSCHRLNDYLSARTNNCVGEYDDRYKSISLEYFPTESDISTLNSETYKCINKHILEWKDLGNSFMKQSKFQLAHECYSKCIYFNSFIKTQKASKHNDAEVDLFKYKETILLVYNNRSQALLKLEKYADSLKDSSFVINACLNSLPKISNQVCADNNDEKVSDYDVSTYLSADLPDYLSNLSSQQNESLQQLKKALFRRAIAYRGIGDVLGEKVSGVNSGKYSNLELAINDLKFLMILEPGNKAAESERAKTEVLFAERKNSVKFGQHSKLAENKSNGKYTSVKPVEGGGNVQLKSDNVNVAVDLKAISTKRRVPSEITPANVNSDSNKKVEKSLPSNDRSTSDSTVNSNEISAIVATLKKDPENTSKSENVPTETKISPKLSVQQVPSEPPKTEYEFERIWRSLRSNPSAFIKYLSTFKTSTLKRIYKNNSTISSDLLSSILSTLLECGSVKLCYKILCGLSQISNFKMTLALLPSVDELTLKKLFDKISSTVTEVDTLEAITELRQEYFR